MKIAVLNAKTSPKNYCKVYFLAFNQISSLKGLSKKVLDKVKAKTKQEVSLFCTEDENSQLLFAFYEDDNDKNIELENIRITAGKAAHFLIVQFFETAIVQANSQSKQACIAFVEALALTNYQFLKYKKEKEENKLKQIYIDGLLTKKDTDELENIVKAIYAARTLVNEPLNFLTATQLAKEAETLGKDAGIDVDIYSKKKIESLKMGGLLAVNLGSEDPPSFTIMEYKPKNAVNKKPYILVGKGVVFDTGGLSLKPTPNGMDIMKCDMGGAAAVIGATYAIAKNKLPIHLITLVPATDNRPGKNAYVPSDVIKMYDGTTVEVLNTDAEGRMLLADALAFAKQYKPQLVIDVATLTGSSLRAIGEDACVMMGTADNNDKKELEQVGWETYERLVELPLWKEYREQIKSTIADIKNIGGPFAGAITAGKFLEHFTDYPWIHLDIAGPAWTNKSKNYLTVGGTGFGVRLLYHFFKQKIKA